MCVCGGGGGVGKSSEDLRSSPGSGEVGGGCVSFTLGTLRLLACTQRQLFP